MLQFCPTVGQKLFAGGRSQFVQCNLVQPVTCLHVALMQKLFHEVKLVLVMYFRFTYQNITMKKRTSQTS